jgi:alkanesulfonate monooxygenase SsuD/methylene tetrahydromethanopterin reductase-like flavin-dependent oxidoreductase (luciferase family)
MEIGIGLPNAVPGTRGEELTEFARRAEKRGFSSLGTIDRLVYPNYDPLIALAAAAAVTERIGLLTSILIAPLRPNAAMLAKNAASVHALSGGRLTLGMAIGAREDDYDASGLSTRHRGEKFDDQIEEIRRIWSGEERGYAGAIGPPADPPPKIVIGGSADASFRRAAQLGDGWMMGGGAPDQFAASAQAVREAWSEAGREGVPRVMALAYFGLGPDGQRDAEETLKDYYEWLGDAKDQIAASAATDPDTVRNYASAFEEAGCDELVLFPTSSDPEQVDLLADAVARVPA